MLAVLTSPSRLAGLQAMNLHTHGDRDAYIGLIAPPYAKVSLHPKTGSGISAMLSDEVCVHTPPSSVNSACRQGVDIHWRSRWRWQLVITLFCQIRNQVAQTNEALALAGNRTLQRGPPDRRIARRNLPEP